MALWPRLMNVKPYLQTNYILNGFHIPKTRLILYKKYPNKNRRNIHILCRGFWDLAKLWEELTTELRWKKNRVRWKAGCFALSPDPGSMNQAIYGLLQFFLSCSIGLMAQDENTVVVYGVCPTLHAVSHWWELGVVVFLLAGTEQLLCFTHIIIRAFTYKKEEQHIIDLLMLWNYIIILAIFA